MPSDASAAGEGGGRRDLGSQTEEAGGRGSYHGAGCEERGGIDSRYREFEWR
jgi:hypothetical protein